MIYADNAATTKLSNTVAEKMLPLLCEQYGNASSHYSFGLNARRAVENARKQVAVAIGAEPSEICFTSGGSEANNWVLRSISDKYRKESMHIITTSIEHLSVLNTCHSLECSGIEVTYLPVDGAGLVLLEDVEKAIRSNTRLVSIMLANNEIGTIQPIAEIGRLLKGKGILFHTDAVQAVGRIPVHVNELQIDFLSASAHKFNGAKGTGILFIRAGLTLSPLILGGKQEHGFRAGTENVAGIVAAGHAIQESVEEMPETAKRLKSMINDTVVGIKEKIPSVRVNGNSQSRLPTLINLCFDGVSGESLMHLLDLKGICVSTSSACTSGNDDPSHVLLALGLTDQQAKSSIRISYGKYNCIEEVDKIVTAVFEAYKKIVGNC